MFVSAGDGGADGCDNSDGPAPNLAESGIAANGLASTPYNVATGGTDFLDTSEGTNSTYWSTANTSSGSSAISYVPEMTWNDSCASSVLYEFVGYSSGVSYCNSLLGSRYLALGAAGGAEPQGDGPVAAVARREITRNPADRGHADAGLLVDLAVRKSALQKLDHGPAIRHRLQFRRRAQVAEETAAFLERAQGQYGGAQGSLVLLLLAQRHRSVGLHGTWYNVLIR